MVALVIVGSVGAMGTTLMRRAITGAKEPAFARSVLSMVHTSRQAALSNGRAARLRLIVGNNSPSQVVSEVLDPNDATQTAWLSNGLVNVPPTIEFCDSAAAVRLGGAGSAPTCPIPANGNTTVCFSPTGTATSVAAGVDCPGTASAAAMTRFTGGGATLYFRAKSGTAVRAQYKIPVWGLTGLPRLVDAW